MVNNSNAQEVLERDPQTQIMTTEMSSWVQTQSSRQALMATIRAKRAFIKSMDSITDMNPYLAVVLDDALVWMVQALNRVNDEKPSVSHSDNKKYFDEIWVYDESYTLEHWPDDTEYMVPSRENTKLWWSTLESGKKWHLLSFIESLASWSLGNIYWRCFRCSSAVLLKIIISSR